MKSMFEDEECGLQSKSVVASAYLPKYHIISLGPMRELCEKLEMYLSFRFINHIIINPKS